MSQTTSYKRIQYLDIAKGVGIVLVVLGHCQTLPEPVLQMIFSVHMPLFFILSGYNMRPLQQTGQSFQSYVRKSARMLLIPYGLTCGIVIVLNTLTALIHQSNPLRELVRFTMAGLYGSGILIPPFFETAGIPITFIGAIWFLLALFFARIFFILCLKSKAPGLWTLILFAVGYVTAEKIGWFPFSVQAGLCAVLFLYIGYQIRQMDLFRWSAVHWVLKLLMLCLWIYCIIFCGHMYMVQNMYMDGFLDVAGGICGTFVIVYLSMGIEKTGKVPLKLMSALGRSSLGIMCGHLIILDCVRVDVYAAAVMNKLGISYELSEILVIVAGTAIASLILYLIPGICSFFYPMKKRRIRNDTV